MSRCAHRWTPQVPKGRENRRFSGGTPVVLRSDGRAVAMKAFLGFVSGLLTVGVFLIAYGVLNPRASAMSGPFSATGAAGADFQTARPMFASERVDYPYSDRLVPVARQE